MSRSARALRWMLLASQLGAILLLVAGSAGWISAFALWLVPVRSEPLVCPCPVIDAVDHALTFWFIDAGILVLLGQLAGAVSALLDRRKSWPMRLVWVCVMLLSPLLGVLAYCVNELWPERPTSDHAPPNGLRAPTARFRAWWHGPATDADRRIAVVVALLGGFWLGVLGQAVIGDGAQSFRTLAAVGTVTALACMALAYRFPKSVRLVLLPFAGIGASP